MEHTPKYNDDIETLKRLVREYDPDTLDEIIKDAREDVINEVMDVWWQENLENAKKTLTAAILALAEVNMAIAKLEESKTHYQTAMSFYFDAGDNYRNAGVDVFSDKVKDADNGYNACKKQI